ncbi:hypothetical protein PTKIN_Ptkin14bG0230400 [Pterospermum kingtungense]
MGQTPPITEHVGDSVPTEWCGHLVPAEWCGHSLPSEWYGHYIPPEPYSIVVPLEIEQTPSSPEERGDDIQTYTSKALREEGIDTLTSIDTETEIIDTKKERLFHVPRGLKKLNPSAYEPQLVSVGPRYHGNEHLRHMEWQKNKHFDRLFNEKGPETKKKCEDAMRDMKKRVHDWYGDRKIWEKWTKTLEKMMLVDGCFVIILLLGKQEEMPWINPTTLLGDLLLFENQLPLFLLEELYGLIRDPTDEAYFAQLACDRLNKLLPESRKGIDNDQIPFNIEDTSKIDHLLGLVHDNWVLSRQGTRSLKDDQDQITGLKVIRCATELEEAGIIFKENDRDLEGNAMSLFDVEFKDGKMKMPTLVIDGFTERVFLNLIAYEVRVRRPTSYVIDYARLMFNLVKKADDVKLLRLSGVIQNNMLADDEAVAKMLKKILEEVPISDDTFLYHKLFDDVKKHCERRWNHSVATLRHNYLNTPWRRIGLGVGIVLFLIAVTQLVATFLKKR